MAWVILITSATLEAVWATALGASDGFSKLGPTILFAVSYVISMWGLAWAMKTLPTSIAYSVWVGVGASLAVAYSMMTGAEPATFWRIFFLMGIIACIAGLKFVSDDEKRTADA